MGMIGDLFVKLGLKSDDFNKGIDEAKKKFTDFGGAASEAGNKIAGVFGTSLDRIKSLFSSVAASVMGVVEAFKFAASGGAAAAAANEALAAANGQVIAAQTAQAAAQARLDALQATGTASAEALSIAESEVATASAAATVATSAQTAAQITLTAATGVGAIAMNILRIAMISTGIGALVVVVGSLVAYFTQTREGANKIKIVMSEIGAVVKVLIDRFSAFGQGVYKLFTLDFKGAGEAFKASLSGIGAEISKEVKLKGDLTRETIALNKAEREGLDVIAQKRADAARLRADAKDESVAGVDKVKKLKEAKQLLIEAFQEEKRIAEGRRDILQKEVNMRKTGNLDTNSKEQLQQLAEAKVKVIAITEQQAATEKGLWREMRFAANSANKDIKDGTEEKSKAQEYYNDLLIAEAQQRQKINDLKGNKTIVQDKRTGEVLSEMDGYNGIPTVKSNLKTPALAGLQTGQDTKKTAVIQIKEQEAEDKRKINAKQLEEEAQFNQQLNSLLSNGLASAATTFGEGLGALMTGDMNFKDFGKSLLAVVGQFLVQLGQLMITLGIGMTGLKAAISTMNPVLAIGAGIALVAAGSAISSLSKKGLSGGGGSGSTASGGGSYVAPSNGRQSQTEDNKVVFEIQGSKLVGVLNNAEKRKLNFG